MDAIGSGNVPIRSGVQVSSPGPMRLRLKRSLSDAEAAKQAAIQAARRAARNNADSGNHEGEETSPYPRWHAGSSMRAVYLLASAGMV